MSGPVTGPVARTAAYDAVALATKGPVTAWVVVPRAGQTPDSLLALFAAHGLDSLYRAARPQPSCSTCRGCTPRSRPRTCSPSWKR